MLIVRSDLYVCYMAPNWALSFPQSQERQAKWFFWFPIWKTSKKQTANHKSQERVLRVNQSLLLTSALLWQRDNCWHTHTLSNKDNKRKKKKTSTYKLTDSGEYLHSLWRKSYCSDNFSSSHFSFLSATYAVISFLNTLVIRLFSFLQSKENLDTVSSPRFICKCNNCL